MSKNRQGDAEMTGHPIHDVMAVTLLRELDLGQHILLIMNDGSIEVLIQDEQRSYNGIYLNSDETYRLFLSLQEQLREEQEAWARRGKEAGRADQQKDQA